MPVEPGAEHVSFGGQLFKAAAPLLFLLMLGTLAMSGIEGWTLVDGFYFTVATTTTVGWAM